MKVKEQDMFEKVLNMLCDNKKVHSLETLYKVKFVCERMADEGMRESVSEYLADKEKIEKLLEDDVQMYESAESRYRKDLKQILMCFLEEERKDVLKSGKRYYFTNKELIKYNKILEIQEQDRNKSRALKREEYDKLDYERDIKEIVKIIEEFYLTKEICLDFMQIDEEDPYSMFDLLIYSPVKLSEDDEITDPDAITIGELRDEVKKELIKAGLVIELENGGVAKKKLNELSGKKQRALFEIEKKVFFNIPYNVWDCNKILERGLCDTVCHEDEFEEYDASSDAILSRTEKWYDEVCEEMKYLSKKDIELLAKRNITKKDILHLEKELIKKWGMAKDIEKMKYNIAYEIDEWVNFIFETEDITRSYRYYKELKQIVEKVCGVMRDKLEVEKIKRKRWKVKKQVKKLSRKRKKNHKKVQ